MENEQVLKLKKVTQDTEKRVTLKGKRLMGRPLNQRGSGSSLPSYTWQHVQEVQRNFSNIYEKIKI